MSSGDAADDGERYVIVAAGIVNLEMAGALAVRLQQGVFSDPTRTRSFHWRREGVVMRETIIDLLRGVKVVAVHTVVVRSDDQESVFSKRIASSRSFGT